MHREVSGGKRLRPDGYAEQGERGHPGQPLQHTLGQRGGQGVYTGYFQKGLISVTILMR